MLLGGRTKNISTYYGEYLREHWAPTVTVGVPRVDNLDGRPRNITVTSATEGVVLDRHLCTLYINRIINGELDSIAFKNYTSTSTSEGENFILKIHKCTNSETSPRIKYIISTNETKSLREIAFMTGLVNSTFIYRVNKTL